jgi:hypothetical protein
MLNRATLQPQGACHPDSRIPCFHGIAINPIGHVGFVCFLLEHKVMVSSGWRGCFLRRISCNFRRGVWLNGQSRLQALERPAAHRSLVGCAASAQGYNRGSAKKAMRTTRGAHDRIARKIIKAYFARLAHALGAARRLV